MQIDQLKRREFITLLGGAVAAWPVVAHAQQPGMPVIGFLDAGSAADRTHAMAAFRQGLAEADFAVNRNVAIIAAFGNNAARAAKVATKTIPVAFASSSDPVTVGLVTSLTRPGANVTGVSILNQELESTRLERLVQVVPHATTPSKGIGEGVATLLQVYRSPSFMKTRQIGRRRAPPW